MNLELGIIRSSLSHGQGIFMRVFVAGATGVLGQRVVPTLLAQGHSVTGIGRAGERLSAL